MSKIQNSKKIQVAFNNLPLRTGHKTRGIGAYTKSLLEALKIHPEVQIQEFGDLSEVRQTDIIHYPFFDLFQHSLSFRKHFPTVVTIHDAIPLAYSEHYPPGLKGFWNNLLQKIALKNVAAVVTDSETSKKDIVKFLQVPAKKVSVIPLAPAGHFRKIYDKNVLQKIKEKYRLPETFGLYTGNVNWNKNLLHLTEAALKAGIDLVLIGKSFEEKENLDHPEMRSFKNFLDQYSGNPKVHILGFVQDEDLVVITNLAAVLLLPSLVEGFGLPILEAQLCGVPVITSNISSMPEVAGKGALLVDPNSVESIAQAIIQAKDDKEARENLIKEGLNNIQRFSWDNTAQETIKVYDKILNP